MKRNYLVFEGCCRFYKSKRSIFYSIFATVSDPVSSQWSVPILNNDQVRDPLVNSHANTDPRKGASNLVPEFHMGSNSSTFTGFESRNEYILMIYNN
jgi:hypothetical protein